MSFYKEVSYIAQNGAEISTSVESRGAADILTSFLTEKQFDKWITDDFRLDNMIIKYSGDDLVVKNENPAYKIVSIEKLANRFNNMIVKLIAKGLIKNDFIELFDLDDTIVSDKGWQANDLALALAFISTVIDAYNESSEVIF